MDEINGWDEWVKLDKWVIKMTLMNESDEWVNEIDKWNE